MKKLDENIQQEIERIVRENWPVDRSFVTTLNEMGDKVCSEFGMPNLWLNQLIASAALGFQDIIKRKDDEELTRLVIRMYFSGLLQGAKWQGEKGMREARDNGSRH